jgi:hypothetical protein
MALVTNIDQISRTKTALDGTESFFGRDGSGDFKSSALVDNANLTANGYHNYIIDGDFYLWSLGGTPVSSGGYYPDMWYYNANTATGTVERKYHDSITADKRYFSFDITANPNGFVGVDQRLHDAGLVAGKDISGFVRAKSSSGVSEFYMSPNANRIAGSSAINSDFVTIPNDDTWRWYRFDVTVPDITGLTISAGNHTELRFRNRVKETFTLDIDKIRVIDTPENYPSTGIPEWIKGDESVSETIMRAQAYYYPDFGAEAGLYTPFAFGKGIDASNCWVSIPVNVKMVQNPTITITNQVAVVRASTGAVTVPGSVTITSESRNERYLEMNWTDSSTTFVANEIFVFMVGSAFINLDARY